MNKVSKGNYYRLRTKKYLQEQGYSVENMERTQRIFVKGKIIFIKRDIFASDLLAMNDKEMIFVQVKSNKGDISTGLRDFEKFKFPSFIQRWVVYWPPRSREPEICQIENKNQS